LTVNFGVIEASHPITRNDCTHSPTARRCL